MREFIDAALIQEGRSGARKLADLVPLLTTPDGKRFAIADLPKNERIIVTFGAEWCGPCRVLKADLHKMEGFTRRSSKRSSPAPSRELN
jgi:thiol-disulfide isomerase/thioredoxin